MARTASRPRRRSRAMCATGLVGATDDSIAAATTADEVST